MRMLTISKKYRQPPPYGRCGEKAEEAECQSSATDTDGRTDAAGWGLAEFVAPVSASSR
jgi:hypothetical protein